MTENSHWSESLTPTVAAEVARLRKAKKPKWSIKRLAEETERLGFPIGQSVLSNLEYGRRGARLDVSELLVLAAALDVPPARLLWPNYPDGLVEYLPEFPTTAEQAALIFTGRLRADFSPHAVAVIGGQLREVDELLEERLRLYDAIHAIAKTGGMPALTQELERISKRRDEINRQLSELGFVVSGADNAQG